MHPNLSNTIMIKKLFLLWVSLACLTSCSKENGLESPEAEKVQVKFNVQALDVNVEPMKANSMAMRVGTRAAATTVLTNIQYYLKNTTTGKTYSGEQTLASAGSDFGNIALWIPAGTYQITFFGYGASNSNGSALMYVDNDYNKTYVNVKDKDSFFLNTETTISDATNQVDVNLSRLNGKLVIKLNDVIPSDIKKIKAKLSYLPLYDVTKGYAITEGSSGIATIMESYLTIQSSAANEFGFYVLPQAGRTLTLSIYDELGTELGSCSVAVSFYQNKRTIVEGNLLDVINQKPFAVTVSDVWDTDVNVPLQ